MKRQNWWIGLLVLALLSSGCAGMEEKPAEAKEAATESEAMPTSLETTEEREPTVSSLPTASDVILMDGELVSTYPALDLAFPASASGLLEALHVELGQRVREGDLLAVLDDTELRKNVTEKCYGPEAAKSVRYAEGFEICEYGHQPTAAEFERLFPFLPKAAHEPQAGSDG